MALLVYAISNGESRYCLPPLRIREKEGARLGAKNRVRESERARERERDNPVKYYDRGLKIYIQLYI